MQGRSRGRSRVLYFWFEWIIKASGRCRRVEFRLMGQEFIQWLTFVDTDHF